MIWGFSIVLSLYAVVGLVSAAVVSSSNGGILSRDVAANTYFSSSWTDGTAQIKYTNGAAGEYSVTWTGNKGDFVCGKGWATGGPMSVNYTGTFSPNGNAYLSIYGWTTNPLVEYYIVESYGTHNPSNTSEAIFKGNVTSDGEVYTIFTKTRTNAPSIIGTATFKQYWSVRNTKRTGGTVTTGNHYTAWTAAGLPLGKFSDMIVAVEGQNSTGTASITVGVAPTVVSEKHFSI